MGGCLCVPPRAVVRLRGSCYRSHLQLLPTDVTYFLSPIGDVTRGTSIRFYSRQAVLRSLRSYCSLRHNFTSPSRRHYAPDQLRESIFFTRYASEVSAGIFGWQYSLRVTRVVFIIGRSIVILYTWAYLTNDRTQQLITRVAVAMGLCYCACLFCTSSHHVNSIRLLP